MFLYTVFVENKRVYTKKHKGAFSIESVSAKAAPCFHLPLS
ncbi:MAG: hypothetical protein JWQ63_1833 [Mucilaginibacter sp.]|jgi:hypothetical protein|nr:hypothetical protein [Mucilaginibacter sp.]